MNGIAHVSYSRLKDYEACPRKAQLKYVDKVPEPEQPDSPMVRGTRMHADIESYIRGEIDELPKDCEGAQPYADAFREAFEDDPAQLLQEQMWAFTEAWEPQEAYEYGATRFLAKLDVVQFLEDGLEARLVDWKSGKKYGNEISHADQMMFYTIAAFARYEDLTHVTVMLRYLDQNQETVKEMTRMEAMAFLPKAEARIKKMLTDANFYPDPSLNHCRYCPFKTGTLGKGKKAVEGTGHCNLNPV